MKKKILNKPTGPPESSCLHILPDEGAIPVIGSKEKFYGYIVGLGVGLSYSGAHYSEPQHDTNCYVMFEYNGKGQIWRVPDYDLFVELGKHLNGMAYYRFDQPDDYGYSKLWIGKTETGTWSVQLP